MTFRVFIGWDQREQRAASVCLRSLLAHASCMLDFRPINLYLLGHAYHRPFRLDSDGRAWDKISNAPMSTSFSLARFWVPEMAQDGWALYIDGDVLFRADVAELFRQANPKYAVQVVKHQHAPTEVEKKTVPGVAQVQTSYERKNWSSAVLWNLAHPAHRKLRWTQLNIWPGLWLQQFGWLEDGEIGGLDQWWNVLNVDNTDYGDDPKAYHYTRGTPDVHADRRKLPYADEWFSYLTRDEQKAVTAEWLRADHVEAACKPANSVTA